LDEASVNEASHFSAKRVHFPHKVAFGKSAYRRIAGKRANTVRVLGYEQAREAKPRNGEGSLDARVASAYNYTIVIHKKNAMSIRMVSKEGRTRKMARHIS
jgi:aldehyde:ferredoxin oxidoreductase